MFWNGLLPLKQPNSAGGGTRFNGTDRIVKSLDNGRRLEKFNIEHCGVSNMTIEEFRQSLTAPEPPAGLTHALLGLWWDAKGEWKRAHESAQQDEGMVGLALFEAKPQ
jgi:hypothetical protein